MNPSRRTHTQRIEIPRSTSERSPRPSRRMLTMITAGLLSLVSCVGQNDTIADNTCAIVSAQNLSPDQEAKRWGDEKSSFETLKASIKDAIRTEGSDRQTYTICIDENNVPYAETPDNLQTIMQYGYAKPEGYYLGSTALPGIVSVQRLEELRQSMASPVKQA